MRYRALHRWIGESERQDRQVRHIDEGMIEAGTRIRHSLAMGIQIERRTAILDPTGISALSFASYIALGNILTERLQWTGNLAVADPAPGLHDVKWLLSLQICTG
jgi:hypothetical protein